MNETKQRARAQKAERRAIKRQRKAAGQCVKCGAAADRVRQRWQRFENGKWHLREECSECGKYRRFAPQAACERETPGPARLVTLPPADDSTPPWE
jgi:hypothetical protein